MQSYKMRKIIETVLFPIEEDIKGIKEQGDKSWTSLMWQIFSVVFSGIGTTLLCQDNFIPSWVKVMLYGENQAKQQETGFFVFMLEFLVALAFFGIVCVITLKCSEWAIKCKDGKGSQKERQRLIEYFHKVILNNILTGISFVKKINTREKAIKELPV